jgi:hypothetical protein
MCGDKEVTGTYGESASDLPINLEAGLFRVGNGTVPIRVAVPNGSWSCGCTNNTMRHHLAGFQKLCSDVGRCRYTGYRYIGILVQFIYRALRTSPIGRQIRIGYNGRTLWIRDEEEGHRIPVVEEAEARANNGF